MVLSSQKGLSPPLSHSAYWPRLVDLIRDFPAEDIWEMERYAEFLAARRELPKKKKATTGPMETELPENWRRA